MIDTVIIMQILTTENYERNKNYVQLYFSIRIKHYIRIINQKDKKTISSCIINSILFVSVIYFQNLVYISKLSTKLKECLEINFLRSYNFH